MITGRAIYSGTLNLAQAIHWLKINTCKPDVFC
jgi:hypothetical protein